MCPCMPSTSSPALCYIFCRMVTFSHSKQASVPSHLIRQVYLAIGRRLVKAETVTISEYDQTRTYLLASSPTSHAHTLELKDMLNRKNMHKITKCFQILGASCTEHCCSLGPQGKTGSQFSYPYATCETSVTYAQTITCAQWQTCQRRNSRVIHACPLIQMLARNPTPGWDDINSAGWRAIKVNPLLELFTIAHKCTNSHPNIHTNARAYCMV